MPEAPHHETSGTSNAETPTSGYAQATFGQATAGDLDSLKKELGLLLERAELKMRHVENITYFGFIIIILMVAGLVFAYWQFTYSANREIRDSIIENKFKMLELNQLVNESKQTTQDFKNCIWNNGLSNCLK